MDVLLLSHQDDFESVLPTLDSLTRNIVRLPLGDAVDAVAFDELFKELSVDVAIIDARRNLAAARAACRRLTASAPAVAAVAVVTPADFVAIEVDCNFDDVLLEAAGADELRARLRLAIARRCSATLGTLQFGDLMVHPSSYTVSLAGKDLGLTLTEFKLLNFLVQNAGRAFSRTRLMHEVWGYDRIARVRTVDVHVRRLRAKLGTHEAVVDTVRGVGYMAVTPPEPQWVVSGPGLSSMWTPAATLSDQIAQ